MMTLSLPDAAVSSTIPLIIIHQDQIISSHVAMWPPYFPAHCSFLQILHYLTVDYLTSNSFLSHPTAQIDSPPLPIFLINTSSFNHN